MPRYFNTTENDLLYAILLALTNVNPTILNAEYNSTNDLLAAILLAVQNGGGGGGGDDIHNQFAAAQAASFWIGDNARIDGKLSIGARPADNNNKVYVNGSVFIKDANADLLMYGTSVGAFVFDCSNNIYFNSNTTFGAPITVNGAGSVTLQNGAPILSYQDLILKAEGSSNIHLSNNSTVTLKLTANNAALFGNPTDDNISKVMIKGGGSTSATNALHLQNSSAITVFKVRNDGAVLTDQPSTNGAGAFKIGKTINAAVTLNSTKYLEVEVDGTILKLLIAQ